MNTFSWDLPGVGGLIRLPCSGHISYQLGPHQPICFLAPLKVNSLDNQWPKLCQEMELPKKEDLPHPHFLLALTIKHPSSVSSLNCFLGLSLSLLWHTGSSIFVAAREISFPDQGWNPGPPHWEHGIVATGPPGKSHQLLFTEHLMRFLPSCLDGCVRLN